MRYFPHHDAFLIKLALMRLFTLLIAALFVCGKVFAVDFRAEIAPLFRDHCLHCHYDGNEKGDFSLSTAEDLRENEYVIGGDAEGSHLLALVTSTDGGKVEMPKEGEPLSQQQVSLIRDWIQAGAEWPDDFVVRAKPKGGPDWWAFQPLRQNVRSDTDIDSFIDDRLARQQLQRNEPADRSILIRRATLDLIGLPPTPEEVSAFVNDDAPDAYEKLIDRLLQSPHYGERWGRHWLDVVRFGESNGFERNVIINDLWPFRDYVIRSLNTDKPFDQFIQEHLAGDVIDSADPATLVGSAFLVAGPYDNVGNQDPDQKAQIRANTIDEMIRATSEAFLGLTVGCSRCHDHKFDPITQDDYYSLYSTFSAVFHGSSPIASVQERKDRDAKLAPLNREKAKLTKQQAKHRSEILKRALENLESFEKQWTRTPVDRTGTTETFDPTMAKYVKLTCVSQDNNPATTSGFRIDEFQIWSHEESPRNIALSSNGAIATGPSRQIEDFPGAYGPRLAIDGKTGARFLSTSDYLTIELKEPTKVDRIVFSSARGEENSKHNKFVFVADYRIEVSIDGKQWTEVANGDDRKPTTVAGPTKHRDHRLVKLAATDDDRKESQRINQALAKVNGQIRAIPKLPTAWTGSRNEKEAEGPFHIFLGGSPKKKGDSVSPHSLSAFELPQQGSSFGYLLDGQSSESERRTALAKWIVHADNPLPARVLANRLWHYHFGTGIVSTPSDFGFMGQQPSHPELLDFLAMKLKEFGWRIKPMHRLIMLSNTYRQSSNYDVEAAKIDGDARLLWRYPPRRMSAEEIRDSMLQISGAWRRDHRQEAGSKELGEDILVPDGGPGFRLYRYLQDNVATYVPLDQHDDSTYRRAVYHQNARASVVDLMTEFDQPDCAFSTPRRARTTTPLQALTMLNHQFTLDMADILSKRLTKIGNEVDQQIDLAFQLCFSRSPDDEELEEARDFVRSDGLAAFCRAILNTSELIYVR